VPVNHPPRGSDGVSSTSFHMYPRSSGPSEYESSSHIVGTGTKLGSAKVVLDLLTFLNKQLYSTRHSRHTRPRNCQIFGLAFLRPFGSKLPCLAVW